MDRMWDWIDSIPAFQFFACFAAVLVVMHLAGVWMDRRQTARRVGRR